MKFNTKHLARGAFVGALYAALCLFLAPISYNSIQLRLSEALCVLPIFLPEASVGLFVGCFIANLLGGGSVALFDMIFGSLTTLIAALLTRKIYAKTKSYTSALLPPVVLNAIIVGTYVPFLYTDMTGKSALPIVLASIASIGVSEALVIYVLGLPLCKSLNKTGIFKS